MSFKNNSDHLFPLLEEYVFLKKIDHQNLLFDAVSDSILKISSLMKSIINKFNGYTNLTEICNAAKEKNEKITPDALEETIKKLIDLKMVRLINRGEKSKRTVLLINPSTPFHSNRYRYKFNMPPLGLLYIAAELEGEGYEVKILDMFLSELQPSDITCYLAESKICYDLIGISCNMSSSHSVVMRLVSNIKDKYPDIPIIIGGNHASNAYGKMLSEAPVDYIATGPGEETMVSLCKLLFNNSLNIQKVPGLAYKQHNKIQCTESRKKKVNELDNLTPPAYHLIQPEKYDLHKMSYVITSRGCPYSCVYCSSAQFHGQKVRFHSVDRVISDVRRLIDNYKPGVINFLDDAFTFNKKRVREICRRLKQENWNVSYMCTTRVDMVDRELLSLLKETGFTTIFYGIESISQEVLNGSNKKLKVEQIKKVICETKEAGIRVKQSYILGLPHETDKTIQEIWKYIKESHPEEIQVSMLTVSPGTQIALKPRGFGLDIKELEWREFNINIPHAATAELNEEELFDTYLQTRLML